MGDPVSLSLDSKSIEPPPGWLDLQAWRVVDRVKGLVVGIAALLALGATLVGWNLNDKIEQTQGRVDRQLSSLEAKSRELDELSRRLGQIISAASEAAERARAAAEGATGLADRTSRAMLSHVKDIGAAVVEARDSRELARHAASQSEDALQRAKVAVSTAQGSADGQRDLDERLARFAGEHRLELQGIREEWSDLKFENANTGAFVVFEKRNLQRIEGMDIAVSLGRIAKLRGEEDQIQSFAVHGRGPDAVWGPHDLRRGAEISFRYAGFDYVIVPTYTLQFWGRDAAGLSIRRKAARVDGLVAGY